MSQFVPVVLAGGKGVRLWPMSREAMPKPYVATIGADGTLLQATLQRVTRLGASGPTLVVCNKDHDFIVRGQARSAAGNGIRLLLESEGRNTAPAICAAALALSAGGEDLPMLVLAADHMIRNDRKFAAAVASAAELASKGHLVTFAIKPRFPATGYGYLEIGAPISLAKKQYTIAAFVEKPDAILATHFLESGRYAWNSGMFMFRPSVILESFRQHQPAVLEACQKALRSGASADVTELDPEAFARAPSVSIDYGIMEKERNVATVLSDFDWSDVGDWQAVWSNAAHDRRNNVVSGNADAVETSGSLVHSDGPLLVSVGLKDMIAVATKDAVMIAPLDRAQDVKMAVERLKANNHPEALLGKKVVRPWGTFEQLHIGPGFQVKELAVLPGAKLSLQRHKHRGEHWVCTAGTGYAVRDRDRIYLSVGSGVLIPQGSVHRLENPGDEVLRIVEVQIGDYTGEDDIERFEDDYGRV